MAERMNTAAKPDSEARDIDLVKEAGSLARLTEALEMLCESAKIGLEIRAPLAHLAMLAADKAALLEHHLNKRPAPEART
jgi:hypothetical protein